MSDRERIFKAVRGALEAIPERTAYPEWESDITVSNFVRNTTATSDVFRERMETAHGKVFDSWDVVAAFLKEQGAEAGYVDERLLADCSSYLSAFRLEHEIDRERIDDYAFGITVASGAIAETGSLILRDEDSPYRLAALAPWIHIAVVEEARIFRTVSEAVAAFGSDPSIVWATGPSKTADVEGILIEGVHGPGVQAVLIV